MKSLIFFSILFISLNSQAATTLSAVTGASNDVIFENETTTFEVLGGLSGMGAACTGQTTTIDSCIDGDRSVCNKRTICPSTELGFTITSDVSSGKVVLYDEDGKVTVETFTSTYTPGSAFLAKLSWGKLCSSFGLANCIVTSLNVGQLGSKIFNLGVDSDGDGIPNEAITLRIGIHAILNDGSFPDSSLADILGYGVGEYKVVPGDAKAFVMQMESLNGFAAEGAAKIVGVAAFVAPGGCGSPVTHSDPYAFLEFNEDTSEILTPIIEGLENDIEHVVMFGFQDAAGNIGAFKDIQSVGTCVTDRHTVTPREVFGLLEEDMNCYITTAAYGSPLHAKVKTFKRFRDEVLTRFDLGKQLIRYYYKTSPPIAEKVRENKILKVATQAMLWPAWAISSAVLYMGLMPFLFVVTMSFLSFIFLRDRKSKAKKLVIAFLALSFVSSPISLKAQDDFFSTDSAPNEPPYNGTENEEFSDFENEAEESISAEEEYEPVIEEPKPVQVRTRRSSPQVGESPEKWKPYQRVPEPQRLQELADEGLMKITKKGEYLYQVKPTPQNKAASFRFGMVSFPNLQNATGRYFDEIYGDEQKPMVLGDFEWQFFSAFGKLGLKLGTGIMFANGNGVYAYDYNDPDTGPTNKAQEKYNFFMFPNSLSLVYRLDIFNRQWIVPYGEIGIDYFTFLEIRDDAEKVKIGGSPHFHFAVGGSFLLDILNKDAMTEIDAQYGVNHIWLTAEYRRLEYITGQFDFSDDIMNAGIMVEF